MAKTAKEFDINRQTIAEWKKLENETGSLANRPLNRSFKKIDPQKLKEIYDKTPDAFQKDVAKTFDVCQSSIQRALKKNSTIFAKRKRFVTKNAMKRSEKIF
jgi:transposase